MHRNASNTIINVLSRFLWYFKRSTLVILPGLSHFFVWQGPYFSGSPVHTHACDDYCAILSCYLYVMFIALVGVHGVLTLHWHGNLRNTPNFFRVFRKYTGLLELLYVHLNGLTFVRHVAVVTIHKGNIWHQSRCSLLGQNKSLISHLPHGRQTDARALILFSKAFHVFQL